MNKPENITINTTYEVYLTEDDLRSEDRMLLDRAKEIAKKAYAPYSNFQVGAALLLENGEVITGNNQENAAYPSGLCAERTAVFYASSQFPNMRIKSIAISYLSASNTFQDPITPCGACRQVLAEYEIRAEEPIRMIMSSKAGKVYITKSIESLLPIMFNRQYLK